MIEFVAGALIGAAAGWLAGRRRSGAAAAGSAVGPAAGAHLLPEPALRWLLRAHGAIGVWVTELDPAEEGPQNERVIDAERLAVAQVVAVDRRLERARDQEQGGVERMEAGTLVFRAAGGFAVALLVPEGHDAARLHEAESDLDRLLEGVRRRPQIVALAQAQPDEGSLETAGSVGLRLAYQLERVTQDAVVVVSREGSAVRVVGVSGRGDKRLLDTIVPHDAPLARAARGEVGREVLAGDPMGGASVDRRQRSASVLLVPLATGGESVGAVALWLQSAAEPIGAVLAEISEAVGNAAPRVARALETQALRDAATADPLTGLGNRRALDAALQRHEITAGTLVVADLDKFKTLNDSLGHPAGDAALVHFARILREGVRGGDTAARIGGEEFAVWLPGAPLEVGIRIAERIRVRLGTTPWDWQGQRWPLSASFGVASCPETSRRIENLPGQADAALYAAKHGGRNRVAAAPPAIDPR